MTQDFIAFDGFEVAIDLERWPAKILRALLRRHYEKHELRLVSRLLTPDDRVIELGSAIGVVALAASRTVPSEQICCFDANPEMVAASAANFRHAGKAISARNAVMVADGSAPATMTFYKTPYFLSSSLSPDTADATPVEIETRPLAATISQQAANVLIVDIEGGEFDLLAATDLSAVEKLVLEIHVSMAGVDACLKLVSDLQQKGLLLNSDLTGHNVFVFSRGAHENRDQGQSDAFATAYFTALERSDAGDRSGAIEAAVRATGANPNNAHAHLLLSQLEFSQGHAAPSLRAAKTATELDPRNEDAFEQLGVAHSVLGDLDASEQAYSSAITLVPHRPLFYMGRGAVQARRGQYQLALIDFKSAAALCPDRAATIEHLIDLAARRDKAPESDADTAEISAWDSVDPPGLLHALGEIVSGSFRFPDAAGALTCALKADADDLALHCALAALVATPKDIRKALQLAGTS